MKYLLTLICFALTLVITNPTRVLAAFPLKTQTKPVSVTSIDIKPATASTLPAPAPYNDSRDGNPAYGITSFGLSMGGLFLMIAGVASLDGNTGIALYFTGVALGIVGIVLGAIGFRHPLRGLAAAGFSLGIVEAVFGMLALFLIIIFSEF